MTVAAEVSGDRLARSATCAWLGCPVEIPGGPGLAAYCDTHKRERARQMRQQQLDAAEIRDFERSREGVLDLIEQERGASPIGSYERRALALAHYARELDVAIGVRITAHMNEDRAHEAYRRALRALAESEGL